MTFAMNRNLLEREWVLPRLTEFEKAMLAIDPMREPVQFVEKTFGVLALSVRRGHPDFIYDEMSPQAHFYFALMSLYEDRFKKAQKWVRRQAKTDNSKIMRAIEDLRRAKDPRVAEVSNARMVRFKLSSFDDEWLLQTCVPEYFGRLRDVLISLRNDIHLDLAKQRDILQDLIPGH